MEDASRRRSHLLLPRYRQPDAAVPAPRCLLADVEPAGRHAAALRLARRPVQYPASAPDQARRQGRGAEAKGPASPAARHPKPGNLRPRAEPAATHALLSNGANAPHPPDPSNFRRRQHRAETTPIPGGSPRASTSALPRTETVVHDPG